MVSPPLNDTFFCVCLLSCFSLVKVIFNEIEKNISKINHAPRDTHTHTHYHLLNLLHWIAMTYHQNLPLWESQMPNVSPFLSRKQDVEILFYLIDDACPYLLFVIQNVNEKKVCFAKKRHTHTHIPLIATRRIPKQIIRICAGA